MKNRWSNRWEEYFFQKATGVFERVPAGNRTFPVSGVMSVRLLLWVSCIGRVSKWVSGCLTSLTKRKSKQKLLKRRKPFSFPFWRRRPSMLHEVIQKRRFLSSKIHALHVQVRLFLFFFFLSSSKTKKTDIFVFVFFSLKKAFAATEFVAFVAFWK